MSADTFAIDACTLPNGRITAVKISGIIAPGQKPTAVIFADPFALLDYIEILRANPVNKVMNVPAALIETMHKAELAMIALLQRFVDNWEPEPAGVVD